MADPEFFHVDCEHHLDAGRVMSLDPAVVSSAEERELVDEIFAEGVSAWGQAVLCDELPLVATLEALGEQGLSVPKLVEGHAGTWIGEEGARRMARGRTVLIELMAETTRLARFPDKPSRLASVYAYRGLDEAKRFALALGYEAAPIWRLRPRDPRAVHIGDSAWLRVADTGAITLHGLVAYWEGTPRSTSHMPLEVLLGPPVEVLGPAPSD